MTLIEAARLALGELSKIAVAMPYPVGRNAITALSTAIEEAEKQQPVAWNSGVSPLYPEIKDGETISVEYVEATPQPQEFVCSTGLCHYKSAAQRHWVSLTPEQVRRCFFGTDTPPSSPPYWWEYKDTDYIVIYNIIEAKLKEQNT